MMSSTKQVGHISSMVLRSCPAVVKNVTSNVTKGTLKEAGEAA